jgi:bifunctional oligoribonuclease and PAP phosphatase NrnA
LTKIPDLLIEEIGEIFERPAKSVLFTHINPDGDAIGTMLGLYWFMVAMGHKVTMVVPNEIPFFLQWLPGCDKIIVVEKNVEQARKVMRGAEVLICVDFNEPERLNHLKEDFLQSKATKVLIDHHPGPEDFTDILISIPETGSASELVYELITGTGHQDLIDKKIAECFFVGIMTDTGCFNYNSSKPETYRVVADLLERGIDKDELFRMVYDNYSADRMRLLGFSLDKKMVVIPEYRTAYIALTREELARYNHVTGDTEGFVNLPFSIKGIILTALFLEKEDYIKISFRSRGEFEINKFSEKHFNGGGHKNAAGGEAYMSLDDTIKTFKSLLPLYKKYLAEE